MNKSAPKGNVLIPILIVLAIGTGLFLLLKSKQIASFPQESPQTQSSQQSKVEQKSQFLEYTSKGFKILLKYPDGWFIQEEYPFILVSNFKSSLHKDIDLKTDQVEITIGNFSGCFQSIEENLIDPACGEGGLTISKNKIISKEIRQTAGGTFYKYVVGTPKGNQFTYYLLEKGKTVLQISKKPDPSQFDKEFDEIVNSIKFL